MQWNEAIFYYNFRFLFIQDALYFVVIVKGMVIIIGIGKM